MEENIIVIRDPKRLILILISLFWLDVDENLKHETEFIINSKESLTENKIKIKTEHLISTYKYGNDIHKLG